MNLLDLEMIQLHFLIASLRYISLLNPHFIHLNQRKGILGLLKVVHIFGENRLDPEKHWFKTGFSTSFSFSSYLFF